MLTLTTSMGWSIYGERLLQEANAHPNDNITFQSFTPSQMGRRISWQPRYADRVVSSVGLIDPFTVAYWQAAQIPQFREKYSAAIVATQNLAAGLMRLRPTLPIFIILDVTRELYRNEFGTKRIRSPQLRRERKVFERAAHIFAASEWAAQSVIRTSDIAPNRVTVIPPLSFRCDRAPLRAPLASSGRLQLLFVGLDFKRKGGAQLLRWQRECWHQFADLHIVTRACHSDLSCPNTRWYGEVDNENLIFEIMPRMDLLVHPAERECCGLVVAEAAGHGVPAVVSAVNGLQETVQHNTTGLVARNNYEFPSLVSALERDRRRLAILSVNAKTLADQKYSSNRVYRQILDVVQSHLQQRKC